MLVRIRSFFQEKGFIEVETPILSHDVCVDRHLHPISIPAALVVPPEIDSAADPALMWLQTSPEFGMKRLLAAGATHIYQITKSFRFGERGIRHNPEFTMLEWYRTGDDLASGMDFLSDFIGSTTARPPATRISYQDLFDRSVGLNPHTASLEQLRRACLENGIHVQPSLNELERDDWLNLLLAQAIEPQLGFDAPVMVYDWPASQSALAQVRDDDPPVAERFELFINGMEIANGYHELLDANELRLRNESQNRLRRIDGNVPLPAESFLLSAMEYGIPGCAGVALGIDRLAMIYCEQERIDRVIPFPIERA